VKNKKFISCLLILCLFFATNVFAIDNHQRINSVDSDIYEGIRDLYLSQSLALPSAAAPYSDAELIMMLDLLDPNKFSTVDKEIYNYVLESLELSQKNTNDYGKIDWGVDFNLEGYVHSNTEDFQRRENFQYDFQDAEPLINIGVEAWDATNFYGLGNFSIGNNYSLTTPFGSNTLTTNVVGLPPNDIQDLDMNMPYRAFIAFGNDTNSLSIGRDRVKWGNGVASNLLIGDNLPYLDQLRYTNFSNQFKYTFLTAFFPHPSNYINDGIDYAGTSTSDDDPTTGLGQGDEVQGTYALIAHRGEGRLFNNKVGIALSETIMYSSLDNVLDLRYLSPTALFHDYYIRANANSMASLEIDYTPFKNFNIFGQMVVDEFALPGEPVPGSSSSGAHPNAFGYLAGVRYNYDVLDKYKGSTSLEFAYTDPYLYLRGDGTTDSAQTSGNYGISYVVAFREFSPEYGTWYHNEYLGYEYGGDAIVVNLNSTVKKYGKWNVEANLFYMLHGTFDKFTTWKEIDSSDDESTYTTPTTDHSENDNHNNDSTNREASSLIANRDSVSRTLVLGTSASYDISENLNIFAQLDYINIKNYQNVSGKNTSDVQLVLSFSYSI
jgi:hypothetical protein